METTNPVAGPAWPPSRLTPGRLRRALAKRGIYISNKIATILYVGLLQPNVKAFMFRGPAGTGKTSVAEALSSILGAREIFFQCTAGITEDDLIYRFVPSETTKSGIRILLGPLPRAVLASRSSPVVVVLDEFDKTRPTADALLLDFLQNGRVSVNLDGRDTVITGNPGNIVVILTSNNERDFSEPLLRRVVAVDMPHLPANLVERTLRSRGIGRGYVDVLVRLYQDTINAGLEKPATIQELLQLGRALMSLGGDVDLTSLVRAFVIKTEEDWERFASYVAGAGNYRGGEAEDYLNDLAASLPGRSRSGAAERGCVLSATPDAYTSVILYYDAPPSDTPTFIAEAARVTKDNITIGESLTLDDVAKMRDKLEEYEEWELKGFFDNAAFHVEAPLSGPLDDDGFRRMAKETGATILYYSKKLWRLTAREPDIGVDVALIEPLTENPRLEAVVTSNAYSRYNIEFFVKVISAALATQKSFIEYREFVRALDSRLRRLRDKIANASDGSIHEVRRWADAEFLEIYRFYVENNTSGTFASIFNGKALRGTAYSSHRARYKWSDVFEGIGERVPELHGVESGHPEKAIIVEYVYDEPSPYPTDFSGFFKAFSRNGEPE